MACDQYIQTPYGMALVVSSTTRPTTAPDLSFGRVIAEADTGRILWYDGTGWIILDEPNQVWVTAWTGLTKGAGIDASFYHRSAGYLDFEMSFTLGVGSSVGASNVLTLPVTAAMTEQTYQAIYLDNGVQRYQGNAVTNASNSVLLGTFASPAAAVTSLVPFTWGSGDGIFIRGRYRMVTRYS